MASMTVVICANNRCKKEFEARTADVKRGWGKFCSKSCKAKKQTKDTGISGPDYRAEGRTVRQMKGGKYSKSKLGSGCRTGYLTSVHYEDWDDEVIEGDVVWSNKYGAWVDFRSDGSHPFDSDAAGFNNT